MPRPQPRTVPAGRRFTACIATCAPTTALIGSHYSSPVTPAAPSPPNAAPEAWEYFKADYLRNEAPAAERVHERLARAAAEHGWTFPSVATFVRRIKREIPRPVQILARQGMDALKRAYPAQERDRSVFRALEAVNADGHRFDVFVKWPDGEIGRPVMVAWQDLYSGKIVAYRVDKTENTDAVRLSFGDLVEHHGIPEHAYLDNGRAWASKWMTGGMATRYRFKVKEEEPLGLLTALLGKDNVHWTTPYHGQAKPIERALRDFCESVAKHPALAGAYTGNKPDAKPENYGSRAVPIDLFLTVLVQEIAAHNARKGRRSAVCQGRSFDETFNESYARGPVKKATAEQRRLWLLAAEVSSAKNKRRDHARDRPAQPLLVGRARRPCRRRSYRALRSAGDARQGLRLHPRRPLHLRGEVHRGRGLQRHRSRARALPRAQSVQARGARHAHRRTEDGRRRGGEAAAGRGARRTPQARVVRAFTRSARLEAPKPRELDPAERAIQQRLIAEAAQPQVVQLHDSPQERYARACSLERRLGEGLPVEGNRSPVAHELPGDRGVPRAEKLPRILRPAGGPASRRAIKTARRVGLGAAVKHN